MSRLQKYLLREWKVNKSYSGRSMVKINGTVLWQYIPSKGLVYTLPDGTTYVNNKKIGKMIRSDDPKATHKKQLASFYSELGFKDKDKRQYIEDIYETFVRGRIVDKNIYVYSSDYVGIKAKKYNRMMDKAIDMIYKYVDEGYNINEAKVLQTDADVFLQKHASVFMWSPQSGLIWARYVKTIDKWKVYQNSKEIRGDYTVKGKFTTHEILQRIYKKGNVKDFIRGRIKPDGREIYIHNHYGRNYTEEVDIHYDRYVDKTVDAIYKYMGKYIK